MAPQTRSTNLKAVKPSKPHPHPRPNKKKTSAKKTSTSASASTSTMSPRPQPEDPVFFWREYNHPHACLSQWYSSPFSREGSTYPTAEMWMMVSKARLFGDEEVAQMMLESEDPKECKKLGRLVKGFDEEVWNANKMRIVEEGNWLKFTESAQAEELQRLLLETGDMEIVEASPFDKIWGIGFSENNAEKNLHKWGKNLLGIALMAVRKRLREQKDVKKE